MGDEIDIASLYDHVVAVGQAPITLVDAALFPEESAYLAAAVPKRRAEFGAARVCARKALAELGVEPCPLVPDADRAPVWPPRIVGSISHAHDWCAVVVCPTTHATSIGLDLEGECSVGAELEALTCTARERDWLGEQHHWMRARLRTLIFSAKEAAYKCQYPLTRRVLDFRDLEIDADLETGRFLVRPAGADPLLAELTTRMAGRMLWSRGLVVTATRL